MFLFCWLFFFSIHFPVYIKEIHLFYNMEKRHYFYYYIYFLSHLITKVNLQHQITKTPVNLLTWNNRDLIYYIYFSSGISTATSVHIHIHIHIHILSGAFLHTCWKSMLIFPASRSAIIPKASWDRSMVPWQPGGGQKSTMVTTTCLFVLQGLGTPLFVALTHFTLYFFPQAAPPPHSALLAAAIITPSSLNPLQAEAA